MLRRDRLRVERALRRAGFQWITGPVAPISEPIACATCDGAAPACGDGVCGPGETCGTCPPDCGLCGGPEPEPDPQPDPEPEPEPEPEPAPEPDDPPVDPVDAEDCGDGHTTPGCGVPEIEDCVCESDPYCCTTSWDELCAGEVEELGCGKCP